LYFVARLTIERIRIRKSSLCRQYIAIPKSPNSLNPMVNEKRNSLAIDA